MHIGMLLPSCICWVFMFIIIIYKNIFLGLLKLNMGGGGGNNNVHRNTAIYKFGPAWDFNDSKQKLCSDEHIRLLRILLFDQLPKLIHLLRKNIYSKAYL